MRSRFSAVSSALPSALLAACAIGVFFAGAANAQTLPPNPPSRSTPASAPGAMGHGGLFDPPGARPTDSPDAQMPPETPRVVILPAPVAAPAAPNAAASPRQAAPPRSY